MMKTIIMLLTAVFLFAMMIVPFNVTAQEIEQEIGPPARNGATEACSTGWTGWLRPINDSWQSGSTTYAWIALGRNYWVRSTNDVTEQALLECVSSAHYCQFFVNSCASGYGDVSVVRMWYF